MEEKTKEAFHDLLKHQHDVGLTEEQVDQLLAIELDFDRSRIMTKAKIQVAEVELKALLKDQDAELGILETKVKEAEQFRGALILAAIKSYRQAFDLLTSEQRKKAKIFHAKVSSQDEPESPENRQEDDYPKLAEALNLHQEN